MSCSLIGACRPATAPRKARRPTNGSPSMPGVGERRPRIEHRVVDPERSVGLHLDAADAPRGLGDHPLDAGSVGQRRCRGQPGLALEHEGRRRSRVRVRQAPDGRRRGRAAGRSPSPTAPPVFPCVHRSPLFAPTGIAIGAGDGQISSAVNRLAPIGPWAPARRLGDPPRSRVGPALGEALDERSAGGRPAPVRRPGVGRVGGGSAGRGDPADRSASPPSGSRRRVVLVVRRSWAARRGDGGAAAVLAPWWPAPSWCWRPSRRPPATAS